MAQHVTELLGAEVAACLAPMSVTLITARDEAGADKVATVAWAMPISHEPSMLVVAIRPGGQTSEAMERGSFVVNVLPAGSADIARVCGKKHGIDDRIAQAGLSLEAGKHVDAARVAQAVSWLECAVEGHEVHGDHELFIARVLLAETAGRVEDGVLVAGEPLLIGQRNHFGHFEED